MERRSVAPNSWPLTRRALVTRAAAGVVALTVATAEGPRSPAEARAQGRPFVNLTAPEGDTLGVLGDTLLPGAEAAGIAHFVDDQLGRAEPLFVLTYLDYPGSYLDFYREGLQALDALSQTRHRSSFVAATPDQRSALVGEIANAEPAGWHGPSAQLFYYALRSDAVDVVYGTPDGFAKLNIPYMAHIQPTEGW